MQTLNYYIKEQVGILEMDQPDSRVNVLTTPVMVEINQWLDTLKQDQIKGIMIVSRKKDVFIAGADIHEIEGIRDIEEGQGKSRMGQEVFLKLERLKVPTLAVINGACLGGGLELALACKYRVSGFNEKIKIGLPEVQLGVVPGFGGTVRLPKLIGPRKAIELISSGKPVSSREAFKIGLVNWLFQDLRLIEESFEWFKKIITNPALPISGRGGRRKGWVEKTPVGRAILFSQAKKQILKQTKGVYPAPLKALWLIRNGSYKSESKIFGELVVGDVSKNLIKLFFLNEKYKKEPWVKGEFKAREVQKCGILGAGVMGGGIAQLLSFHNIPARMKDLNISSIAKGLAYASGVYQKALKKRKLRPNEVVFKMGLISGTLDYTGFKNCAVVIEAVVEDLEIKKKVFGEISNVVKEDAILASNTSALSISKIAKAAKNPSRVAGMHFFNPVHLMPLVEVIKGQETSDETVFNVVNFSRRLGKVPIVVKDSCGFLINRILLPYLNEAGYIFEEGSLGIDELDRIAVDFGMPVGPFTLMDEIGIDVGYKVARILEEGFGKRMEACGLLKKLYDEKLFGKKVGAGFYLHKGKKKLVNKKVYDQIEPRRFYPRGSTGSKGDVMARVISLMVNEAAMCLEEGIVGSPSDVDIGMIMGTGFPPFRGGLLRYADKIGIGKIAGDLKRFRDVYGKKFEPCKLIEGMAKKGEGFYGHI